jgi:hypothetical protein
MSRNAYAIEVQTPDEFGGTPTCDWLRAGMGVNSVLTFPHKDDAESVAAFISTSTGKLCSVRVYARRLTA